MVFLSIICCVILVIGFIGSLEDEGDLSIFYPVFFYTIAILTILWFFFCMGKYGWFDPSSSETKTKVVEKLV